MSYDLAVWEGERPSDDKTAEQTYLDLYDCYLESEGRQLPTEQIASYVAALLKQWPESPDDEDRTSPWSAGLHISDASGPLIYLAMRYSMAAEVSSYAAGLAESMDLVCFDPQQHRLRP